MMRRGWAGLAFSFAFGAVAPLAGCSPDASSSGTCTPDPALIAARRDCRADDQCPCGSHCALGRCVAECGADERCGPGQRCDSFGRCRGDGEGTPPIEPSSWASKIELETAEIRLPAGEAGVVRFRGRGGALGPMRVVARAGVELLCEDAAWKTECLEEGLAAGIEKSVPVRLGPQADAATVGSVLVFSGSQTASVTVRGPNAPQGTPLSSGRYVGAATLVALSLTHGPAETPRHPSPSRRASS